ncbi:hypothetical protein [Gimesia sp.]|uniref:hypothetical protein n=1 Tax=Gimesia sp. TaxID=2024833 RepID=UPI003A9040F0
MNNNAGLPSSDELAELPNRSIAVYAIRCALRVQPLLASSEINSIDYKDAVLILNSNLQILTNTAKDLVSAAAAISTAAKTIEKYAQKHAARNSVREVIAGVAKAADYAAEAYATYSNTSTSAAKAAFAADAVDVEAYDLYSAPFGDAAFSENVFGVYARADYVRLKELEIAITDASETGPLGDLWHGSPPDWYIEAKERYDKAIAEWERELAEYDKNDEERLLSVYVDPGTSSPELITELYIALNALYRANGGSGLEIAKEERRSMAGEIV